MDRATLLRVPCCSSGARDAGARVSPVPCWAAMTVRASSLPCRSTGPDRRPAGRAFFTTLLLRNSKERGKPRSDLPEWDASRKACLTRRPAAGPEPPHAPGPPPAAAAP
ncbi:hypothetical protein GCM10010420_41000 [Streptomyces glaucosporus]|uniref:Secreted protein n=1 Tax=Streptomyces glaucosporus TaxID=284044 RepID=A0ABP5VTD7_9ACTN